ncbi:MAG TPA: tRNA lysidine(34) synthetase TilS [bacterium]|nr:tRNA lysidine(34) synthetase TilS [bacterium]
MSAGKLSVSGRFFATVKEYGLLPEGSGVLVAVSGGADSVCLLDLLRLAQPRFNLKLAAFHLNHGLRESAARDERFVRKLCQDWRVELVAARADVAGYAKRHKMGIEEAGRELRYRHMERAARKLGCGIIALGHTANDNLETMLLNLARGAGPRGLAGIPVTRTSESHHKDTKTQRTRVRFARPLIDIERSQLEQHLRARGIGWVEDESNLDVNCRRNLLRHEVVPVMLRLNAGAVANARRAAQLLTEEGEFLDSLSEAAVRDVAECGKGRVRIDLPRFKTYNVALKRRILKLLLPELDSHAVEGVLEFCNRDTGGKLTLTRGVRAHRHRGMIELERTKEILNDA